MTCPYKPHMPGEVDYRGPDDDFIDPYQEYIDEIAALRDKIAVLEDMIKRNDMYGIRRCNAL